MSLRNLTVFIADADEPSGRALIGRLAGQGAQLALNSPSGGAAIEAELEAARAAGARVLPLHLDLCSREALAGGIARIEAELGLIGLLVHNRQRCERATIAECSESLFLDILDANAKSAFLCTQAIGGRMAERGSGSIVYVTSIHAEKPTGASFAYSASQGAIGMLAAEAALELGRRGVRVNTVQLGPVQGPSTELVSPLSALYDDYERKTPLRTAQASDLASLAIYLAGDTAGALHGATIRLDGGLLLHYMDHKMKPPSDDTAHDIGRRLRADKRGGD
ncbi:SDR family oxidoreductase [Paenibacillus sp. 598K]|uniref:SDR family NAD(P)-dependent oxidoreductase n=1 Tax=Paenibacillus sp. 598K TaxID=1117987 RepID=UPI000FFA839F|nr:SDR family oxidoreductase [Paenibacillus sp. 598K]GBF76509.1 SDR family oxidoreductase [Paenibacillus sp. 598K]